MPPLYPLRLEGSLREKIWGATDLRPFFGERQKPVGEAWYSHEENVIRNGPLAGSTLGQLIDQYGPTLLGTAYRPTGLRRRSVGQGADISAGPYFPILAKLLFTSAKLSVQVHPDDAYAIAHEGGAGKAEMWYVVDAEPGARINAGLTRQMSEDELAAAARSGAIENDLRWVEVRPGDAVYIPPGALHTIGPGLTICEIQQNSDLTYRFYDFNRLDDEGEPRELHIGQAAQVTRTALQPSPMCGVPLPGPGPERRLLTACEHFGVELLAFSAPAIWEPNAASFDLLIFLAGSGTLGERDEYAPGVAYLVPASAGSFLLQPSESTKLIRAHLPDRESLRHELAVAGVSSDRIRAEIGGALLH